MTETKKRLKSLFQERGKDWILPTCTAIHDDFLYTQVPVPEILDTCDELVKEGFLEVMDIDHEVKNPYREENRSKAYRIVRHRKPDDNVIPY